MNCFEFRRVMLADPRACLAEYERHRTQCPACAALAQQVEHFESTLHDALNVPVPEGLADRILLGQKIRWRPAGARAWVVSLWKAVRMPAPRLWALAATLAIAVGAVIHYSRLPMDRDELVLAAASVGFSHPAVAAINYVVEHESQLLREGRSGDPDVMRGAFMRLGLNLPANGVTVRYLGKCPVPGGTGEHVVLQTPVGKVTLILVPDQPFASRVVVAVRDKTAVAMPARAGGYILVSDSLKDAKLVERLLVQDKGFSKSAS